MIKALLLGDYKNAGWHPLRGVDDEIKRVLDGFEITVCEDYPYLKQSDMRDYNFIINYIDAFDKRAGTDFAGEVISYIASGGAILTLHSGIIMPSVPEMQELVGGAFKDHPPQTVIEYVYAGAHPIMKEVPGSFSIDEEPYQFIMDNLANVHIIMEYIYEGKKYPAAWLRGFGKGKSCYLSMGHSAGSFKNEGFEKLLIRSALWCAGEL